MKLSFNLNILTICNLAVNFGCMGLIFLLISTVNLQFSSDTLRQGEILYLVVSSTEQGLVSLTYRGEPYPLIPCQGKLVALIGTSYKTSSGRKPIQITFNDGWNQTVVDTAVRVICKEFRKSVITLPDSKQHTIDNSMQERKQDEYQMVVDEINRQSQGYYCLFPQILPVAKKISGTYGDERWSNGQKLWHHSGLDFAVPEMTPILAPCPGKVVMARDTFIRQGTFVILDHGAELKTLYYHMIKRAVDEGEEVNTGDTLGFVGSTGIATGPHLHMSVYVHGIPVDPLYWLEKKEPF